MYFGGVMFTKFTQRTATKQLQHLHFKSQASCTETVLLFSTWAGISDFEKGIANNLSQVGYDVWLIDIYGVGVNLSTVEAKKSAMTSLLNDFNCLRLHLQEIAIFVQEYTPQSTTGFSAIGYCLGGLCAIQAALFSPGINKGASFHGLLDFPYDTLSPDKVGTPISLLIMNGASDPMVPTKTQEKAKKYFNLLGVNWTFIDYGNAMHSFTIPGSNNFKSGIQYHELAASQSWHHMLKFIST